MTKRRRRASSQAYTQIGANAPTQPYSPQSGRTANQVELLQNKKCSETHTTSRLHLQCRNQRQHTLCCFPAVRREASLILQEPNLPLEIQAAIVMPKKSTALMETIMIIQRMNHEESLIAKPRANCQVPHWRAKSYTIDATMDVNCR